MCCQGHGNSTLDTSYKMFSFMYNPHNRLLDLEFNSLQCVLGNLTHWTECLSLETFKFEAYFQSRRTLYLAGINSVLCLKMLSLRNAFILVLYSNSGWNLVISG